MDFLFGAAQARPKREQKPVRDDFLLAQLARHGGEGVALLDPDFGRQRALGRQRIENTIVKQPGRERDPKGSGEEARAYNFHDRTARPVDVWGKALGRRKLVFREVDLNPAFDLAQKTGKRALSARRTQPRIGREAEGAVVTC